MAKKIVILKARTSEGETYYCNRTPQRFSAPICHGNQGVTKKVGKADKRGSKKGSQAGKLFCPFVQGRL